ncbi:MAG: PLDc N-terminal domain-containing protein [Candidatus Pacearchaeota archaeon]|nr:PLDc N-terminal domain-containing protein [Candidatus Pacearchaeota archaeon]
MRFGGIIGVIAVICAVLVIYDVAVNQKKMKDKKKIVWIIFAVLFSIITAIVYYFVVKKK